MDHLALPKDPISQLPLCPLICDPRDSIDHDFETFPLAADPRTYWSRALNLPDQWEFSYLELQSPSKTVELEQFLQAWLYFCLLQSTITPFLSLDTDECTKTVNGQQYLRSDVYVVQLEAYSEIVRHLSSTDRRQVCIQLRRRLLFTAEALRAADQHKDFSKVLRMTLESLVELLSDVFYSLADADIKDTYTSIIDLNDNERGLMLSNGWCPFEIKNVFEAMLHNSARVFLRNLVKPCKQGEHTHCTDHSCLSAQIDLQLYTPKHADADCDCCLIGTDGRGVEECLRLGTYPLLDIEDGMKIVQYEEGLNYIALSHVWADGLGNPSDMSLPSCQINRLKLLLHSFQGKSFSRWADKEQEVEEEYIESRKLYLWCDTLCCPVRGAGKSLALSKLRQVYFNATYALVLDTSLEAYSFSTIGGLEAMIRIASSKWFFRGWTLQEAGLPRALIFKFADSIVDLRDIWKELKHCYKMRWHQRQIITAAISSCVALRAWLGQRSGQKTTRGLILAIENFQRRRFSVSSDEPLCLAEIFGLDTREVISTEAEKRMETVWRLFSVSGFGISQSMICNNVSRMKTPGYGWAPSTLLNGSLKTAFGHGTDVKGQLTSYGLLVTGKAWILQAHRPPQGIIDKLDFTKLHPLLRCSALIRGHNGEFWDVNSKSESGILEKLRDDTRTWFIVFDANPRTIRQLSYTALLAYQDRIEQGLPVLRSVMPVSIIPKPKLWNSLWQLSYKELITMHNSWLLRLFLGLCVLDRSFKVLTNWLPSLTVTIATICNPLRRLQASMASRWPIYLQVCAKSACQRPDIKAALQSAHVEEEDHVSSISTYMLVLFLGRYVNVIQELQSPCQYYID